MKKTALQFSGGKDSLAVLYLHRDKLSEIAVYFGDTGGTYPHMKEFAKATCEKLGAELKIVTPDVDFDEWIAARGYPSDVVPTERTAEMQPFHKDGGLLLQSYTSCCSRLLWLPMQRAMDDDGIETIIRGVKSCDEHAGLGPTFTDGKRRYIYPIWDWTDEDVFSFLKESGVSLPDHYETANNSFDCLMCTAFLTSPGAEDRLAYTKRKYPEVWPDLLRRLTAVKTAISNPTNKVIRMIENMEKLK